MEFSVLSVLSNERDGDKFEYLIAYVSELPPMECWDGNMLEEQASLFINTTLLLGLLCMLEDMLNEMLYTFYRLLFPASIVSSRWPLSCTSAGV
jgi:hypothetical protein